MSFKDRSMKKALSLKQHVSSNRESQKNLQTSVGQNRADFSRTVLEVREGPSFPWITIEDLSGYILGRTVKKKNHWIKMNEARMRRIEKE